MNTAQVQDSVQASLRELPDAVILAFDHDLRFIVAAGTAIERRGNPAAYREGQSVEDAFPAELWKAIRPLFCSALEGETRSREIWTADESHCLMVDAGPLPLNGSGTVQGGASIEGGLAVLRDTTVRRMGEEMYPTLSDGFEEIFDRAPVGTGLLDRDGRWMLVNRALCEITGYTSDELIGKRFDGIIHPDDAFSDREERQRLLTGEIPAFQVEKRYFDASGEVASVILSMSLVRDQEGAPLHYIAQLQDISERKLFEEQLRKLADHDPLTGLRNRRLFLHDLHLQVARSRRYGEVAGLLVVDVDGMPEICEMHGHEAGEETLRGVARALTRRLRQTDLVARVGTEQFAVLLPHIDEDGVAVVAEGLARVIPNCSVDVGAAVVHPVARIGYTLIDRSTPSTQAALSEAAEGL